MFFEFFINRRSPNNIILAGLWFSDEKPPMRTFLQPVVEMLLPLESVGGLHPNIAQVYLITSQLACRP